MFGKKAEMTVGLFMVGGIVALIYLSITLGNVTLFGSNYYSATALFDSITGLRKGASVEVAGVRVGKVTEIRLENDMALVEMDIHKNVKLSDDSIASIRTKGVIGEKFIKLTPGGSDEYIEEGGDIVDTESAISLEELISKYIFEK
ncbi:MAG: outer membrane lipid asymmetry maintenance protein MlaD [Thermodesulfobacteriota bacterium]